MQFKFKKIISVILSCAFAFSIVGGTSTSYAASTSALRDKKQKIQNQIDAAQSKINKLSGQKKNTEEYISALDTKIQALKDKISTLKSEANDLQKSINTVTNKINDTKNQIDKIQSDIDAKQAEFDKTFDEYCQRLRAMYVSGHASNLEVLLTSSDISSILTRSEMIKSVSKKDSDTLNELMDKMNEIEKDKAKLQSQKDKLDSNIATVNASKTELDKEINEANSMMRKLNSQTAEYQESISDNEDEIAKIEAQIAAEIRKAQSSSSVNTGSSSGSYGSGAYSGTLGYPTSSRRVSAGYPNYSSGRYHGGVDFPVPSGSPVHAAASGTVIIAKNLNYSYGHYLVIDHGNGLSTLYAHNTTLLVGVGSHVTKGQVIARSGSTGNSTGPHCHFEVRVNGTRVNPFNYL